MSEVIQQIYTPEQYEDAANVLYVAMRKKDNNGVDGFVNPDLTAINLEARWPFLNQSDQTVLIHKYGIYGHNVLSTKQIAELLGGVTDRRVRQLHMSGLYDLNNPQARLNFIF